MSFCRKKLSIKGISTKIVFFILHSRKLQKFDNKKSTPFEIHNAEKLFAEVDEKFITVSRVHAGKNKNGMSKY
jgi:hypothetical protein